MSDMPSEQAQFVEPGMGGQAATTAEPLETQVYVKDLESGALEIASVDPSGVPMTPTGSQPQLDGTSISAGGERVVFTSSSMELVAGKTSFWSDVFVRDLPSGTTTRVLGVRAPSNS